MAPVSSYHAHEAWFGGSLFYGIFLPLPILSLLQSKMILLAALVASASAFAPQPAFTRTSTAVLSEPPKKGAGGMADTRDPEAYEDEDPRKSISDAPSFEEYLKQREQQGN